MNSSESRENPIRQRRILPIHLQFFAEEKTEEPTPKRRREAREKGQVAKTHEFSTSLLILLGFASLLGLSGFIADRMLALTRRTWLNAPETLDFSVSSIYEFFRQLVWDGLLLMGPIFLVAVVVGVGANLAQVGFLLTGEPLKPKLERINPLNGMKRIFSKRALVELLKAILKVTLVAGVAWSVLRGNIELFPNLMLMRPLDAIALVGQLILRLGLWTGGAMLVIALADYGFQRYELNQSLRMTKKEVRDEHKQMEGDPLVRSRLRQKQREIASRRMMNEVPTADVVITNPLHLAVALRYKPAEDEAPVLVAKGAGHVAERIRAIAKEHGIPIVRNVDLARTLFNAVPVGGMIPEELYRAVAEVLAFVYRLKGKA